MGYVVELRQLCMLPKCLATCDLAPDINPFAHSSYSSPSHLQCGDRSILSVERVQQNDPLGSLLFCLTLHWHCQHMSSVLCISYLDYVTIGGSCADILQDLIVVREAESIGLNLNLSNFEIITADNATLGTILTSTPGALVVDSAYATLLGSRLGGGKCVAKAIREKTAALKRVGEKIVALSAHDAFILL